MSLVEEWGGLPPSTRDLGAMMQLMTEDCVFENTYPPPAGTRYEGQAAIRVFWEDFFRGSSQARFDTEDIFGLGNPLRDALDLSLVRSDRADRAHTRGGRLRFAEWSHR